MNRNFYITFICLITLACNSVKNEKPKSDNPNVILILVDDLGWTDLGSFGSDFKK